MKIIILTANFGNGHNAVAQTLKRDLEKENEVIIVNPQEEAGKIANSITTVAEKVYNNITSKHAANKLVYTFYSIMFKATHNISAVDNHFKSYGKKKVTDLIDRENPNVVIAVFPYGVAIPKNYAHDIKVYSVITDYNFANMWYSEGIDGYFVATDDVKEALHKKGVDVSDVHTTGIPIKKEFFQENCSNSCKHVLLTLGAKGRIDKKVLKEITLACVNNNVDLEIVCGRNEKLHKYVSENVSGDNIIVHGFVSNMDEIIKRSDLIITKAGGISISEAIASETPLILNTTRSLAGQEEANIKFVKQHKIGFAIIEKTIPEILEFVIKNDKQYTEMVKSMQTTKKQSYNDNIIDIITSLGNDNKKE
ncbi:MAG: MGDG synthase family glycosyltransferase [Mycoplasmatales bacterium]